MSRKPTSGGTITRGSRLIKAWSKAQTIIAKSSAEAESYSVVRGWCEGLGINTLLRDLGEDQVKLKMHIDATAARGIIERKGLGRVRHVRTDILWLQEQEARKVLPLHKVLGTEDMSDLTTKHLSANTIVE